MLARPLKQNETAATDLKLSFPSLTTTINMSENAKKAPAMNLYDQSESAKKARFLLRTQARCQTFSEWRSPHPAPIFVESLETLQALPQIELYKPVQPDPQCSEIHYSVTPSDSPPDVDETGYKPTGSAAAGKSSIPTEESLGENPQIPLELVLRAINFVERVVRDTCKLQGCPKVGGPLRHWHDPFVDAYLESKCKYYWRIP